MARPATSRLRLRGNTLMGFHPDASSFQSRATDLVEVRRTMWAWAEPVIIDRAIGMYGRLVDDAATLAQDIAPFALPPLEVAALGTFLALRERAACPALHAMADACVTGLDSHRVPADAAEIARRRLAALTPEQDAMLVDWGYPHVLGTWRFHMTLTRRLSAAERPAVVAAAQAHFAPALAQPRRVTDICLFTQAAPGAPFNLAERVPLRG